MVLCSLAVGRAVGGAQVGPVDVGSEFFAADGAICCALDCWAAFCRNSTSTRQPLRRERLVHADDPGQLYATPDQANRTPHGFVFFFHAGYTSHAIK